MPIYIGHKRKSTAINSPRHLVLRTARRHAENLEKQKLFKAKAAAVAVADTGETDLADDGGVSVEDIGPDGKSDLKPGEEQLHSYWKPGLEAGGTYRVNVSQTVKIKGEELQLTAEQDFKVHAPQFTLPAGSVHSVYPPSGHPEDHRILPHVTLTDPHLPWERYGTLDHAKNSDTRNRVPWLALFTFTQDEIKLPPETMAKIFASTTETPTKQTETFAVNMTVGDILAAGKKEIDSPVSILPDLDDKDKATRGDFIFVERELFTSLFSTFDDDGKRSSQPNADATQYKFLSHVREINTKGMAISGIEDVGIFSIVVGNRTGPLDNKTDTSVTAHLVSIEEIEKMKFPIEQSRERVALCSLHSWKYTVQRPGLIGVKELFEGLGASVDVLRPPPQITDPLKGKSKIADRIRDRLIDGYSLAKWRVRTGEETVAFYRGPFTPTGVPTLDNLTTCSNSGQDLQILDKEVGIMDISYASAWQLGRTLALGDQNFTAALGRFRLTVTGSAMKACRILGVREAAGKGHSYRSPKDVIVNMFDTVQNLTSIQVRNPQFDAPGAGTGEPGDGDSGGDDGGDNKFFAPLNPSKRWLRPRIEPTTMPSFHFRAPVITKRYDEHAEKAAIALTKSIDGGTYNSINDPVSTDFMMIVEWVMDRMILANVPAHYFISDPTHLEKESIRFFAIDPNWIESMIDGALSLANHQGVDKDRLAVKAAINQYIKKNDPQIPTYGFLVRSSLVSKFPDMRVTTLPEPPAGRAPLLRHEIIGDEVMLGLFDRVPGTPELQELIFTQPPHQPRFAAGDDLDSSSLTVDILPQYTIEQDNRSDKILEKLTDKPDGKNHLYLWSSTPGSAIADLRMIRLPYYAEKQLSVLKEKMDEKEFYDDTANAALFGMQLSDPRHRVTFPFKDHAQVTSLRMASGDLNGKRSLKQLGLATIRPDLQGELPVGGPVAVVADDSAMSAAISYTTSLEEPEVGGDISFDRSSSYEPAPHALRSDLAPHVRAIRTQLPEHLIAGHTQIVSKISRQREASATAAEPVAATAPTPTAPPAASAGPRFQPPRPKVEKLTFNYSCPAGPPKFNCNIWSMSANQINTGDGLAQDLIFSIPVSNQGPMSDYKLQEFTITIPLGEVDPSDPMLLQNYDGPGPTMLSNLRFNVLTSVSDIGEGRYKQRVLVMRLLPRSSTGWINIGSVDEIGFLLCLAKVNEFKQKTTNVTLWTAAYYKDYVRSPLLADFKVKIVNSKY